MTTKTKLKSRVEQIRERCTERHLVIEVDGTSPMGANDYRYKLYHDGEFNLYCQQYRIEKNKETLISESRLDDVMNTVVLRQVVRGVIYKLLEKNDGRN